MYGYNPLAIEQLHQARITELRKDAGGPRRPGRSPCVAEPPPRSLRRAEERAQSTV